MKLVDSCFCIRAIFVFFGVFLILFSGVSFGALPSKKVKPAEYLVAVKPTDDGRSCYFLFQTETKKRKSGGKSLVEYGKERLLKKDFSHKSFPDGMITHLYCGCSSLFFEYYTDDQPTEIKRGEFVFEEKSADKMPEMGGSIVVSIEECNTSKSPYLVVGECVVVKLNEPEVEGGEDYLEHSLCLPIRKQGYIAEGFKKQKDRHEYQGSIRSVNKYLESLSKECNKCEKDQCEKCEDRKCIEEMLEMMNSQKVSIRMGKVNAQNGEGPTEKSNASEKREDPPENKMTEMKKWVGTKTNKKAQETTLKEHEKVAAMRKYETPDGAASTKVSEDKGDSNEILSGSPMNPDDEKAVAKARKKNAKQFIR